MRSSSSITVLRILKQLSQDEIRRAHYSQIGDDEPTIVFSCPCPRRTMTNHSFHSFQHLTASHPKPKPKSQIWYPTIASTKAIHPCMHIAKSTNHLKTNHDFHTSDCRQTLIDLVSYLPAMLFFLRMPQHLDAFCFLFFLDFPRSLPRPTSSSTQELAIRTSRPDRSYLPPLSCFN